MPPAILGVVVLKHTTRLVGNVAVLELHGKILGETEDQKILSIVDDLIAQDVLQVVMDFSEVQWINSRGLGICVTVRERLAASGKQAKLACLQERVAAIFETAAVSSLFESYDTTEEAIASFA
jgi:anti-anti-sigma factor